VSPPGRTESQLKELRVKRGFSGGLCDEGTPCGYGLRGEMRELNCNYCEGMMAGEAAIADVDSQGRTLNHVGAMGHLDSPRNVFDWGAAATVKEVCKCESPSRTPDTNTQALMRPAMDQHQTQTTYPRTIAVQLSKQYLMPRARFVRRNSELASAECVLVCLDRSHSSKLAVHRDGL
jgi:hypothetical protein